MIVPARARNRGDACVPSPQRGMGVTAHSPKSERSPSQGDSHESPSRRRIYTFLPWAEGEANLYCWLRMPLRTDAAIGVPASVVVLRRYPVRRKCAAPHARTTAAPFWDIDDRRFLRGDVQISPASVQDRSGDAAAASLLSYMRKGRRSKFGKGARG